MDHAAAPDDDDAAIVESGLVEAAADEVAKRGAVAAGDRGDAGKADMAAFLAAIPAGPPVEIYARNAGLDALVRIGEFRACGAVMFRKAGPGAGDRAERRFDELAVALDDPRVAIEREAHHP